MFAEYVTRPAGDGGATEHARLLLQIYTGTPNVNVTVFRHDGLRDIIRVPEEARLARRLGKGRPERQGPVTDHDTAAAACRLANPLNYARNYLPALMQPCVQRVVYLDTDLVLTGELGEHAVPECSVRGRTPGHSHPDAHRRRHKPDAQGRLKSCWRCQWAGKWWRRRSIAGCASRSISTPHSGRTNRCFRQTQAGRGG